MPHIRTSGLDVARELPIVQPKMSSYTALSCCCCCCGATVVPCGEVNA